MASVFFDAFDEVNSLLGDISALIAGTCCVTEHEHDLNVETTLFSIVEKKVEIVKKVVKVMYGASPTG
jgi:hypothetical protein